MISYSYLFQLAVKLALLSFYIGVLIYAIPIPVRGLKRWGGTLLRDSFLSFALAISLTAIMEFTQGIAGMMGGSWQYFDSWLFNGIELLLSLKMAALSLSSLTSYVPGATAARAILGPLNDALTADLLLLFTLAAIEAMVRYAGLLIALIGLVMFAMPFRLGREAGAWFIAFVVAFSVGLQAMPAFESSITSAPSVGISPSAASLGLGYQRVYVKAADGSPLGDSLLELYAMVNSKAEKVAQYWVNADGTAYDPESPQPQLVSMPSEGPVYGYIIIDGIETLLDPYPFSPANYSFSQEITLSSPYILYAPGNDIIVFTNQPQYVHVVSTPRGALFFANLSYGGIVEVRAPDSCNVSITGNVRPGMGSWTWLGNNGQEWYFVGPLNLTASVALEGCRPLNFTGITYMDYATQFFGLNYLSPNLVEELIAYYLVLPFMYVATLTMVTYALARLLGGRRGIMPRVA
jgi:hypothetical protein